MAKIPKVLQTAILKALKSEGYLVTVTEKRDGKLNHFQYHNSFPRGDFEISLQGLKGLLFPFFPTASANANIKSTIKENK